MADLLHIATLPHADFWAWVFSLPPTEVNPGRTLLLDVLPRKAGSPEGEDYLRKEVRASLRALEGRLQEMDRSQLYQ